MDRPIAGAASDDVEFRDFSAESKSDWSEFVERCDEAWLEQLPEFMETLSGGKADQSFSIRVRGTLGGVCVVRVERDAGGKILSGLGPALSPEYKTKRVLSLLEAELLRRAASTGCCAIRFVMQPGTPAMWRRRLVDSYFSEFDFSYGVRGGGVNPDYEGGYHAVSDLGRTVDEIFASLSTRHKRNIKKCDALNVLVKQIDHTNINDEYWSDFLSIYEATTARRVFLGHGAERFSFFRQQLEKGRYQLFNSYVGAKIGASILLETYKNAAYYHTGGSNELGLSVSASVHLHFGAMKMLKRGGYQFYCLGPHVPSISNSVSGNIGAFKSQLGNERWDMMRGERVLQRRKYYALVLLPKVGIAIIPGLYLRAVSIRKRLLRFLRGH